MDKFKAKMTKLCGVGGLKCFCCNPFRKGKEKAKLRRIARHSMKQDLEQRKDR